MGKGPLTKTSPDPVSIGFNRFRDDGRPHSPAFFVGRPAPPPGATDKGEHP